MRPALGRAKGTLSLGVEKEAGISSLRFRAHTLGRAYAMEWEEKILAVHQSQATRALLGLTEHARDGETRALYRRFQDHRKRIEEGRRRRRRPDEFAADVSFAAYLAMDVDRVQHEQWLRRLRGKANALVRNHGRSVAVAYYAMRGQRAWDKAQDCIHISRLRV